jgi:hypothetical protein
MNGTALNTNPLTFVRPAVLAACLGDSPAQWQPALLTLPRFQARLTGLLLARYGLAPLDTLPAPDAVTLAVLEVPQDRLAALPRRCGALWHAQTLAREVRGSVQHSLRDAVGADTYGWALTHRHLGGAADLLREPDALLAAIDLDGTACVSHWLHGQPAEWQAWLQLRLPFTPGETGGTVFPAALVGLAAQALFNPEELVA